MKKRLLYAVVSALLLVVGGATAASAGADTHTTSVSADAGWGIAPTLIASPSDAGWG
ncbi:hypothetical protein [Streptomyces sp. NPDC048242]|uniref:hypothetical protein n=1 Tax=Streptomyces sp. NPDC048242 TaxID=3155026 RepID=UPI00342005C9